MGQERGKERGGEGSVKGARLIISEIVLFVCEHLKGKINWRISLARITRRTCNKNRGSAGMRQDVRRRRVYGRSHIYFSAGLVSDMFSIEACAFG